MDDQELRAGLTLGRYELLVPIAQGGTASVWAARMKGPRGFEKIVAAKVMLAELLDDPDAETMFLDEARTVARIRHPNVAEVLDLGEERGVLFLVMEWVDGEPLTVLAREARARGGVPLQMALKIGMQACAGLHAAHELRDEKGEQMGLVHRDVSPQNVMVGHDGQVKVIDFGVAKAASNQLRTSVGQMKGKVAYMAPEQALGDPVDRRTDVFALGVVLYQLITGKHPFRGDNEFATLGRIRNKEAIEPPKALLPSLPDAVNAIIVKAVSKPREGRYATMLEMQRALEAVCPSKESGNDELASFMKSLLGVRGEKKRAAIREAMVRVDHNEPVDAYVPPAFTESKTLDAGGFAQVLASLPKEAREVDLSSTATPLPGASTPASAPASQRASDGFQVPDFRRRRSPIALIAAAMAIVLGIALAIWSFSGDSNDAGNSSGGAPIKKPW